MIELLSHVLGLDSNWIAGMPTHHREFTVTTVREAGGMWRAIIRRQDQLPITFQGTSLLEFQTDRHTTSETALKFAQVIIETRLLR
jgi:hypothetical protein